MSNILLSFVIPVYNSEQFLRSIIESVILQINDVNKIEIVIIDDGSSDHTQELVNDIILTNEKIHIVYSFQENKGVSSARNKGILLSKGKYIWFVDSDDRIAEHCLIDILNMLEYNVADIFCLGWKDRDGKEYYSSENSNKYVVANYVWNKIFRKNLLLDNFVFFSEQIKNTEDFLFCIKALYFSNKIIHIKKVCYEYCVNLSSCSMNRNREHMLFLSENTISMQLELTYFLNQHLLSKDSEYEMVYRLLYSNVNGLLYSLLRFNYPIKYIKEVLVRLKINGIYPTHKTYNIRSDRFALLSNCKYLYLLACKINNILKVIR